MSDLLPVWGNALVASAYLSSRANSTLKDISWPLLPHTIYEYTPFCNGPDEVKSPW